MKKFVLFLLLVLLTSQNFSQARFPFGAYVSERTPNYSTGFYDTIKACGFNTIVQWMDSRLNQVLTPYGFDVYALNTNPTDTIYLYAKAHFKIWEAEGDQYDSLSGEKIKVADINRNKVNYLGQICYPSNYNYNEAVVYGPNTFQEAAINDVTVNYSAVFKIAGIPLPESDPEDTACILQVRNLIRYDTSNIDLHVDTLIFGQMVVKNKNLLQNQFSSYKIDYTIPTKKNKANKILSLGAMRIDLADTTIIDNNLEYVVIDKANAKLYVDKIVIYDKPEGEKIYIDTNAVKISVKNYAALDNYPLIKHWYGRDEPPAFDCYYPIKLVANALREGNYPSLIQAFNPGWQGDGHGSQSTLHRFNAEVSPDIFMMDYHPCGTGVNEDWNFDAKILRYRLWDAANYAKNFYYVTQSYGGGNRRKPTNQEQRAITLLGLSFGAKGILYWNYESYQGTENYYSCIVDELYQPTEMYYNIRDRIAPRVNGILGTTLLELEFIDHLYYNSQYPEENRNSSTNFIFNYGLQLPDLHMNVGILGNKFDNEYKYVFPVNLDNNTDTTLLKELKLTISGFNNYNNYSIKNIEKNDLNITFCNSYNLSYYLQPSDGCLLQIAPVVKGGGSLTSTETVNSIDTLKDRMTITAGDTLILNKKYYANASITLETGARINTINGYLIINDTSKVNITSFAEPIINGITRNSHPRIIWGKYNTTNPVFYRIYQNIANAGWQIIDTTSNLEYTDDLTVLTSTKASMSSVNYKVEAVERTDLLEMKALNSPLSIPRYSYHMSVNTADYKINGYVEKAALQNTIYSYKLNQNYPNPFNPETIISYELPEDGMISLKVYDILGKEVCTLVNDNQARGSHQVLFNYKTYSLSSGVYFYKLETENFTSVKKMLILK